MSDAPNDQAPGDPGPTGAGSGAPGPTDAGPGDPAGGGRASGHSASFSSSSATSSGPTGAVRTQSWSCTGAAELELEIEVGRLEVTLTDAASTVELELRAEPPHGGWQQGVSGLLDWISEVTGQDATRLTRSFTGTFGGARASGTNAAADHPTGGSGGASGAGFGGGSGGGRGGGFGGGLGELFGGWDPGRFGADLAADTVEATEVSWSVAAGRLTVRSPAALPQRLVPLVVTVRAPVGSRLGLRTGAGDVTVTGRCGAATVHTGSGDLRLDTVDGDAELVAGSGTVSTGAIRGRTRATTGSGDLTLGTLNGPGELKVGSGNLRLGGVRADLRAKTGSGNLLISDAEAGRLDLATGSGDLQVRVHPGVTAELDISSRSGRVRSELDVRREAPATDAALVVHGRTGSGDVLVSRASR